MSNRVNSVIKLRADTIANWLSNSSAILQNNELSIIKYSDGSVGLKLGNGSTYANTSLLKFDQVITNTISDGTNTFNLPDSSGTLSTNYVNTSSYTSISNESHIINNASYVLGVNATSLILNKTFNEFILFIPESKLSCLGACHIVKNNSYFLLPDGSKYAFSFSLDKILSSSISKHYRIKIFEIATNMYKVEVI